ncbi:penicillin acylase family protein [Marinibaculum pumilum]|uniref:Penicillin acylase family protein n=1 Tax=Marinibaculum pumilum TaxID=1766165 RepID=A0ABV7L3H8_9PROT
MRRMRKILYWTLGGIGALAGLLVVVAVAYILWLSQSVPVRGGGVQVGGIARPVTVQRDMQDVPYIRAGGQADAYFALGFVHAQERLWQMDIYRRIAAGRMAEVVGPLAADADAFIRTLGIYRLAKADAAQMPEQLRMPFDSYAAGVNAYLQHHKGPWPPEFGLLFYEPETWTAADSLAIGKLLGLMLTGNWQRELTRAALMKRLPQEDVDFLLRERHDDPQERQSAAPGADRRSDAGGAMPGLPDLARAVAALPEAMPGWFRLQGASASWVVDGKHTESGLPILASDPHLAFTAPGIWYLARLAADGDPAAADLNRRPLALTGATAPGLPFHLLGHNAHVAWGATTAYTDAADLYFERLDPEQEGRYLTPDGAERFQSRDEVVKVRFGDDRSLKVRQSRHGPVISDVQAKARALAGDSHAVALRHPTLFPADSSPLALYRMQFATNVAEFRDALRLLVSPMQNFLFADTEGGIGHVSAGWLPARDAGTGKLPQSGAEAAAPPGQVPFEALPQSMNPAGGRIVNANNSMETPGDAYDFGDDYDLRYRADRVAQMLEADPLHDVADSTAMQTDTLSLMARELRPLLLQKLAEAKPDDPDAARALDLLHGWDDRMSANSAAPLIFTAWLRELNRHLFADELGPDFDSWWDLHPVQAARVLSREMHWCDDKTTEQQEACAEQCAESFDAALESLRAEYGDDISDWRWSRAHRVKFQHPLFGFVPFLDEVLHTSAPAEGGSYTLDRGGMNISGSDPFAKIHGAAYRAVYDMADLDRSLYSVVPGQSGNPFDADFSDKVDGWIDDRYFPIPAEIPVGEVQHDMTLEPR